MSGSADIQSTITENKPNQKRKKKIQKIFH